MPSGTATQSAAVTGTAQTPSAYNQNTAGQQQQQATFTPQPYVGYPTQQQPQQQPQQQVS